jgi:F-type H+-transporting ATPase subunit epsilon
MPIRCEIVSQDRTVFQGDADMVMLPGAAGDMGILEHHSPVLTTLKYGVVRVRQKGVEHIFAVAGGVAEVGPELVTVLADAAENVEEIDVQRAQFARKRAEEALAKGATLEPDALLRIEAALRRSNLRLDVARRFRKSQTRFTEQ